MDPPTGNLLIEVGTEIDLSQKPMTSWTVRLNAHLSAFLAWADGFHSFLYRFTDIEQRQKNLQVDLSSGEVQWIYFRQVTLHFIPKNAHCSHVFVGY